MDLFENSKQELLEIMQRPNHDERLSTFLLKNGFTIQQGADLIRECTEILKTKNAS